MTGFIYVTGRDGGKYRVPTRAHDAIVNAELENQDQRLKGYRARIAAQDKRIAELEAACLNVLQLLDTMGEDFPEYRNISYDAEHVAAPIAQAKYDLRKLLGAPDDRD